MSKIQVHFRLNGKKKRYTTKTNAKISELVEGLKRIYQEDDIDIELFYGGRFLNPNFTLEQIKYDSNYPIDVFTSSDKYKKLYNDLNVSHLNCFSVADNDEKSYMGEDMAFKAKIPPDDLSLLDSQAKKNNVDEKVFYLLYKKLGNDIDKTLNFFNND